MSDIVDFVSLKADVDEWISARWKNYLLLIVMWWIIQRSLANMV